MAYAFDGRRSARAARDAVLRDGRQPRHLPPRLVGGHQARDAVDGDGASCPALEDDVWELYDTTTDWSQAHDLAAEQPERLARAPAAVPRGGREARGAADRRSAGGAAGPRHGGPADAGPGHVTAAVRRHGAPHRGHDAQRQEPLPRGHRAGDRAGGRRRGAWRDRGPGWRVRWLVAVRARRPAWCTATTSWACGGSRWSRRRRCRPARTRCAWSSPMTAAAWPRAAP